MDDGLQDDGLPARRSGDWIKRKHHYLDRYCAMFSVAMRGKWHTVYVDLMAGPGVCEVESTGERLPGSPLVALRYPFEEFVFVEADSVNAQALRQRVAQHPRAEDCRVHYDDWQSWLGTHQASVTTNSLVLAFVDPTGVRQVPFEGMRSLSECYRRVDILMTIQHGLGLKWNMHQYLSKADGTAADRFAGSADWRAKVGAGMAGSEAVIRTFVDGMQALGFRTHKWQLVRNNTGTALYYICLFSRHDLALRFWDKVVLKDEQGQRAMEL